ncbi:MAG: hypothetical protein ABWY07_04155, partial [Burkholderiales bacterium]
MARLGERNRPLQLAHFAAPTLVSTLPQHSNSEQENRRRGAFGPPAPTPTPKKNIGRKKQHINKEHYKNEPLKVFKDPAAT